MLSWGGYHDSHASIQLGSCVLNERVIDWQPLPNIELTVDETKEAWSRGLHDRPVKCRLMTFAGIHLRRTSAPGWRVADRLINAGEPPCPPHDRDSTR
jgi:hypothetical protein